MCLFEIDAEELGEVSAAQGKTTTSTSSVLSNISTTTASARSQAVAEGKSFEIKNKDKLNKNSKVAKGADRKMSKTPNDVITDGVEGSTPNSVVTGSVTDVASVDGVVSDGVEDSQLLKDVNGPEDQGSSRLLGDSSVQGKPQCVRLLVKDFSEVSLVLL